MRTETINIYKFSELSDNAKQKAIDNLYDINIDHDWWGCTCDDAARLGLKITEFDLERGSYVKAEFTLSACEVAQNILNKHGDICETYKTVESFMEEWQPVYNSYLDETSEHYESAESEDKLIALEEEFLKSLQEDYRFILQYDYDYLISDEAITETIKCNSYEFTAEGKLY
jgi:hypothetical protein